MSVQMIWLLARQYLIKGKSVKLFWIFSEYIKLCSNIQINLNTVFS